LLQSISYVIVYELICQTASKFLFHILPHVITTHVDNQSISVQLRQRNVYHVLDGLFNVISHDNIV
jgi:hypothetical protein